MFDQKAAQRKLDSLRKTDTTIAYTEKYVGGLSKPSKMPWFSYSIPAARCNVGSYLRTVSGSVCEKCYARKGRYVFKGTQNALERRYKSMAYIETWAAHMVRLLELKARGAEQYFRWHDSGDVQGQDHIEAIIWIANQLPHIRFWLPTKERWLVSIDTNVLNILTAPNLTVRLSSPMVGTLVTDGHFATSSVATGKGFTCLASQQNGKCGECRACWDVKEKLIDYPLH